MAKYAKIESGVVTNVVISDTAIPGYTLVTDDVGKGWSESSGVYTTNKPVSSETLADAKARAIVLVNATHAQFLSDMVGNVTTEERDTWAVKYGAAVAYLAASATTDQTEMLQREANFTGETLTELSNVIIAKSALYHKLAGVASGVRRSILTDIDDATTIAEVESAEALAETRRGQLTTWFEAGAA